MPKSWQYPRWRRYMMQGVMWVILGGTVGLAALLNHHRLKTIRPELKIQHDASDLHVRFPESWSVVSGSPDTPAVVFQATESAEAGLGRDVTIYRQRVPAMISPLQYLVSGALPDALGLRLGASRLLQHEEVPLNVGGVPGMLLMVKREVRGTSEEDPRVLVARERKEFYATAILPSREAITIQLTGWGPPNQSDLDLIERLAGSIKIDGQTPDTPVLEGPSAQIALANGISVDVPAGYALVPTNERIRANRIDQQLININPSPNHWINLELVPCVLSPRDPVETLFSQIAVRDERWRAARAAKISDNEVRVDVPGFIDLEGKKYLTRGYIHVHETGQALLAIFNGPAGALEEFDAAWTVMTASLKFGVDPGYPALYQIGARESLRLSETGLTALLGESGSEAKGTEHWWLWHRDDPQHYVGWTRVEFESGSPWRGHHETRRLGNDNRVTTYSHQWDSSADLRAYHAEVNVKNEFADGETKPALAISTDTEEGRILIGVAAHGIPGIRAGGPAPKEFVPGAWLAMLLGKVSPDVSMILRTDSFLGYEGSTALTPVSLIISPNEEVPRVAEGETEPMRCLSVQVNGSGEISRWYFRADGEVEQIDFADGLHISRSDRQQTEFNFARDPRMMP